MLTYVGQPVVCPSGGHISKTKQDRPIVTMKPYIEAGISDSVAALIYIWYN